jgi:hypothetical protein
MCKETNCKNSFEWLVAKFFLNGQVFGCFCKDLIIIIQSKLTYKIKIRRLAQTQNQLVCRLMNDKCCLGGDKLHQLFHTKKITLPTNNGCRRCGRSCMTKKNVFIVCIHAYNKQVLKGELNPNPCRDSAHYNLNTTCT